MARGPLTVVRDGFRNLVANIGAQSGGKSQANIYTQSVYQPDLLLFAYETSTWFGKVVDIPADDSVREWREWKAKAPQIELLEAEEKRLNVRLVVREALKLSRLYGGSLIVLGGLPGSPASPLDIERIGAGSIKFLNVVDRDVATAGELVTDPLDELFGKPGYYTIGETRVHASRVVRLLGRAPQGRLARDKAQGWGDSIFHTLRDPVESMDMMASVIADLIPEAKIDIVRQKGLMAGLASADYEAKVLSRYALVAQLKSINNMLLLDADDEYEQKAMDWSGLPDVIDRLMLMLSGAADIPQTRMFGRAPQGMNATGDSDMRNYFDKIGTHQELDLSPALTLLDEAIIRSALGVRPPEIWYEWKPLYTMSEKEAADVEKTAADTIAVLVNTGLIEPKVLAKVAENRMIESGQWPGLEGALDEFGSSTELEELVNPKVVAEEERQFNHAQREGAANQNTPPIRRAANDAINDAQPRPLYVSRKLLNAAEVIAWAKRQGFKATLAADDMHVTVLYSRTAVDWFDMGESWQGKLELPEGGPRLVEPLGDKGAVCLLFGSSELRWRHESMVERGASHDFDTYQPHVTITYSGAPDDLDAVEPYTGKLVFGPEIFEALDVDYVPTSTTDSRIYDSLQPFGDAFNSGQPRHKNGRWKETGAGKKGNKPEATFPGSSVGIKASGDLAASPVKKQWAKESPINSIDGLYAKAEENQAHLAREATAIAGANGATFVNPGVKQNRDRVQEKIDQGKTPGGIGDVVRGGYMVESPKAADDIVKAMGKRFEMVDEGWVVTPAGYFDRKVIVRFENGQMGEVQFWKREMFDAKETGGGHALYERARSLKPDSPDIPVLNGQMKSLYGNVLDGLSPEWKALAGRSG